MKKPGYIMLVITFLALLNVNFSSYPAVAKTQGLSDPANVPQAAPCRSCPNAPRLLLPSQNATIPQNNPSIGCPFNSTRGYGFQILFDWTNSSDPDGIAGYDIFVKKDTAQFPVLDTFVTTSTYTLTSCNGFVIDGNLTGWEWRVRARDSLGNIGPWKTRHFQFEPCRLAGGGSCFAP